MSADVNQMHPEDDEINLWELFAAIKAGWYWLVGGAAVGFIGAVSYVLIVPPQYEATAIVQPATVGIGGGTTSGPKGTEVEPVAQTLERLKSATFYTEELVDACDVKKVGNYRETLASAIKPTIVKGNSLIQLSFRAKSPKLAEGCVGAVVSEIIKYQLNLSAPIIGTMEEQRSLTKRQLEEAERFQSQLEKRIMTLDPSDTKFSQSMLMLNAALSKREEMSKLRRLYVDQSLALAAPMTQQASLLQPIYVPEKPVFPKKTLTALGGLFGGLMLGGLALFVSASWRRFRSTQV